MHAGNTRNHVVAAQRELAARAVKSFGIKSDMPPTAALLDEFGWSHGHVIWLRDIVQQMEPEALVWGKSEEHEKTGGEFPGVDVKYLAQPSVWLKLYHDERKLMLDYGKTIETLRLEQRWQDYMHRQGPRMAPALIVALRMRGVECAEEEARKLLSAAIAEVTGERMTIEGTAA